MPKSLTELTTKEVSLVTRGAVNRRFAVKKDAAMDQIIEAVLKQEAEGEAEALAALEKSGASDKGIAAARYALRLLSGFRDEIPAEFAKAAPKLAGYANDEAHDYAEGDGKFPGKKAKTKKAKGPHEEPDGDEDDDMTPEEKRKAKKDAADSDGDEDGDSDSDEDKKFPPSKKKKGKTMKSSEMPADYREQFEAVAKAQQEAVEKAARLEKELMVEREVRLNKEFVEKAQREFPTLGSPSEVGPVLKSLHAADPKLAGAVEKLLKMAVERANAAQLFGERGHDSSLHGSNENSAMGRIEKAASELVSKSADGKMTQQQAVALVMQRQPELYEAYKAEKNYFRVGSTPAGGR